VTDLRRSVKPRVSSLGPFDRLTYAFNPRDA